MTEFIGRILIALGVLWMVLSGLCTAVFFVWLIIDGNAADVGIVLFIAVPSLAMGAIGYALGRWLKSLTPPGPPS